jgi:hypothetical protein
MPRHPKVKIGGKNKKMETVSKCTIQQMLTSKNPCVTLKVDKNIIRNDAKKIQYLRLK